MRLSWFSSLCIAAGLSPAAAQYLVSEMSFGHADRVASEYSQTIPHFSVQGVPHVPEILSNKVILTPPAPGNIRGGLWSDNALEHPYWTADVDFRVNGPERGGGNLNIWLVHDGAHSVGSSSVYTAGKFEGLAIVIDSPSGLGMIRGFLNDGTTDYKSNTIGGLSFGHCNRGYRNLGRSTQVKIRQLPNQFRVEVDGQLCFESEKISIPQGYKLGVTAASADNPDSFEIFKAVVMSENTVSSESQQESQQASKQASKQASQQLPRGKQPRNWLDTASSADSNIKSAEWEADIPDAAASSISGSSQQFEDLHDRLQTLQHHVAAIFKVVSAADIHSEAKQEELSKQIAETRGQIAKFDRIVSLESKIIDLEREVRSMKEELHSKITHTEMSIKGMASSNHMSLHQAVESFAAPGHAGLIFLIIASQALTVGGYIFYKRRKSSPRKYL